MITDISAKENLQEAFRTVLDHPIQTFTKKDPTFLEIAGFPNYENVFSSLYQFFLSDKTTGLGNLFLYSLQDCVNDHDFEIKMTSWTAETEVVTKKGNRIDLVILEEGDESSKVVIIENKVYHVLNNDLKDYYNHYEGRERFGIVLSLHTIEGVEKPFVNITHKKWINAIKNRLGEAIGSVQLKNLALLQDFIQHVELYYEKPVTMASLTFLFEQAEKIKRLNELQEKAIEQIKKDIRDQSPENWEPYRPNPTSVALRRKDKDLVIYVTTNNLFTPANHHFKIELWAKGRTLVSAWKKIYENFNAPHEIELSKIDSVGEWALVGSKKYVVGLREITNFGQTAKEKLTTEWEPFVNQFGNAIIS